MYFLKDFLDIFVFYLLGSSIFLKSFLLNNQILRQFLKNWTKNELMIFELRGNKSTPPLKGRWNPKDDAIEGEIPFSIGWSIWGSSRSHSRGVI